LFLRRIQVECAENYDWNDWTLKLFPNGRKISTYFDKSDIKNIFLKKEDKMKKITIGRRALS
jgi:hypothetical protein